MTISAPYGDLPAPVRTAMPGMVFPALPEATGLMMLGLLYQFERSEWWAAERLRAHQFRQLGALLDHAVTEVPFYRELLPAIGYRKGEAPTEALWQRIPILTRREVQSAPARLTAAKIPQFHGKTHVQQSSGSTGTPVAVTSTELRLIMWEALTLRDALWHRRDLGGTLCAIRGRAAEAGEDPDGGWAPAWNLGLGAAFVGGRGGAISAMHPLEEQMRWVLRHDPDYLLTHPTVLRDLVRAMRRENSKPGRLKAAITYGEFLPPGLREEVKAAWGVPLQDTYSSREGGYMALQCPEHEHYHVQGEAVLVEILDEHDRPCPPGAIGRVVITPLHNFAMPLLRYENGDHAEAGAPCPCGRGLPVINRILGRSRNMLRRFDGAIWPTTNPIEQSGLPMIQFQLAQIDLHVIEARLVPQRVWTPEEEARLRKLIVERCGAEDFTVEIRYRDAIPRGAGGKYEDFVCELEGANDPRPAALR